MVCRCLQSVRKVLYFLRFYFENQDRRGCLLFKKLLYSLIKIGPYFRLHFELIFKWCFIKKTVLFTLPQLKNKRSNNSVLYNVVSVLPSFYLTYIRLNFLLVLLPVSRCPLCRLPKRSAEKQRNVTRSLLSDKITTCRTPIGFLLSI